MKNALLLVSKGFLMLFSPEFPSPARKEDHL
jgi:hypothetical protein